MGSANRGRHPGRAPGRRRSPRRRGGRGRPLHATLPVSHFGTPEFWVHYRRLPPETRDLADRCFAMLQADPRHPSLRLKRVGAFWSARVGLRICALARDRSEGLVWFCPDKVSDTDVTHNDARKFFSVPSMSVRGERTVAARVGRLGDGEAGSPGTSSDRRSPSGAIRMPTWSWATRSWGSGTLTSSSSRAGSSPSTWGAARDCVGGGPRRGEWIDRSRPVQVEVTTIRVVEDDRAGDEGPGPGPTSRRY